jgi:hypothetical protein
VQAIQNLPQFESRFSGGGRHVDSEEYDRTLQNEAIAQIALETGWRVEDVGPLYRWVFHELEQGAQVQDYLFVLTAKHVKRMLNKRRSSKRSG